jgi:Protein of unknown function (DUF3768)
MTKHNHDQQTPADRPDNRPASRLPAHDTENGHGGKPEHADAVRQPEPNGTPGGVREGSNQQAAVEADAECPGADSLVRMSGKPEVAEDAVSTATYEHLATVLVEALEQDDGWESVSDDAAKTPNAETLAIRAINDTFRRTFQGGRLMLTAGIIDLGLEAQRAILMKVGAFDAFSGDNDPYSEHDFGAIDHAGDKIFWKIDYYDPTLTYGSDNPADPAITTRVLTIMLAGEY